MYGSGVMTGHSVRVRTLYKTILRLHRGMPEELRELGNNYARDEFKRHMKCNPAEANIFMNEWTDYAITVAKQLGVKGPKTSKGKLGRPLDEKELELFRDEQVRQLYELMMASKAEDERVNR